MKKILLVLFSILLLSANLFSQNYPEVSVKDIQYIPPDSLAKPPYDYVSPLNGDTVTITGVVMNAPFRYDDNTVATLHVGGAGFYLYDTSATEWSGIIVRQNGITSSAFPAIDTAMVVKITGVVSEYYTTTQFNLIKFDAQDVVGQLSARPKPIKLSISDFVNPDGTPKYEMEKYEGMYVEIDNVTVTDEISLGSGSFGIFDENNLRMMVGSQSDYYRSTLPAPLAGTQIRRIRGTIETRKNISPDWFIINPIYPDDIEYGSLIPPRIKNIKRDSAYVGFNQPVKIFAQVKDPDGVVKTARLIYQVNNNAPDSIDMTLYNPTDSIFTATIPGQSDSSVVSFFIRAIDNSGLSSTNPVNTERDKYFYLVLNHPPTIQDIQYSPFGSGYSGYENFTVTVRGIVTADTSDIPGRVYIQNGTGPWSGIWVNGTEALKFKRGDDVTVTGVVGESYGVTWISQIDNPSQVTVNARGVKVPAPYEISTKEIDRLKSGQLMGEAFESVLIKYSNVMVIDDNADGQTGPDEGSGGNRNFGEMLVADTSNVQTRVELQDGNNSFNNYWDAAQEKSSTRIKTGDKFDALVGVLFYSYGNYKLVPRKDDDFIGWKPTAVKEKYSPVPENYSLSQNYPNPFNPTTTIEYTVPRNLTTPLVVLKVYDILGKVVKTLVNKPQSAGKYSVSFNADNLTSGVYFYRIKIGDFSAVKKMVLLK